MPRELVFSAWDEMFSDRKQRVLQPRTPFSHPFVEIPRISSPLGDLDCLETDNEALDRFARSLAERFLVSPIAMRIRLVKLGLLHRVVRSAVVKNSISWLPEPSNENAATFF
jgi:hypothetical protein